MERSFDAIVIGSGLAGLVAGACFARDGKRVLVLEKNASLGGAMGVFRAGSLTVEASLHELDGLDDGDPKLPLLELLGLPGEIDFVQVPELYEVRSPVLGEPFTLPHGLDAGRDAIAGRFPAHAQAVDAYLRDLTGVRAALALGLAHRDDRRWLAVNGPLRVRSFWPLLRSLGTSLGTVLDRRFGTDEAVKLAVAGNLQYYGDHPDRLWYPLFAAGQASYQIGGGHFVRGGSAKLAAALAARIEAGGGVAETGRRVVRILVRDGRVEGVEHEAAASPGEDRREVRAPVLFGAAAPHALAGMLPAGVAERFAKPYAGRPLSLTLWTLALGLDRPAAELGVTAYSTWIYPGWMSSLDDVPRSGPLLAADPGATMPHCVFTDYSRIDSGLPGPPYLVGVGGLDLVENWQGLTPEAERERRERWTEALIEHLDAQFPGLAGAVVETMLMTAVSNAKYLGTPGGAIYGFAPEPPRRYVFRPETAVPGLWLASAFGGIGGYTGAMLSGWRAAAAAARKG